MWIIIFKCIVSWTLLTKLLFCLISNYICSLASSNNVPKKASKRNLSGDLADDRHVTNAYKRQRCVQRHESTQSSESFNNDDLTKSPTDDKRSKVRAKKFAPPITSSALWARALAIIESGDLSDKSTSKGSSKYYQGFFLFYYSFLLNYVFFTLSPNLS